MRPFTKAVFEKEGKGIVGSRWTREQVQRSYEIADELLDTISLRRKDNHVKCIGGLVNVPAPLFRAELRDDLMRLPDDEAVKKLGVSVLSHLLERGLDIAATATDMYNASPNNFKIRCASSKLDFFTDKRCHRAVPLRSFEAFKNAENPAINQNSKFSQLCADLYVRPWPFPVLSRGVVLASIGMLGISGASSAAKLFNETNWIQKQLHHEDLFKSPLARSDLQTVVATRMAAARE